MMIQVPLAPYFGFQLDRIHSDLSIPSCDPAMQPTSSVMLRVPARDIDRGHLDNLMRESPIVEFLDRLSMLVAAPFRKHGDPNIVPDTTEGNPRAKSVLPRPRLSRALNKAKAAKERRRRRMCESIAYSPIPTQRYVPYQKLTSPPFAPPDGGYHGAMRRYTFDTMAKPTARLQALYSGRGRLRFRRRWRMMRRPVTSRRLKMLVG